MSSERKFKSVLAELIQTEISFSEQCRDMIEILNTKDLESPQYKLIENEKNLLKAAKNYYQEIAKNSYPWFGKKITPERLQAMSFNEVVEICNILCNDIRENTNGKKDTIGKRVGIMTWVALNFSELNYIINKLELEDDGSRECQKQTVNRHLITPVQRLPRLILLTGELTKYLDGIVTNTLDNQYLKSLLNALHKLNEKWIIAATQTNNLVKQKEEKEEEKKNSNIVRNILRIFDQVDVQPQPFDASASILAGNVFPDELSESQFFPLENPLYVLENNNEPLKIPDNLYDELMRSVNFVGESNHVFEPIVYDDLLDEDQLSEEENSAHPPFTLSQIGGGVGLLGGIILIAASIALIILQPELFLLGICLICAGYVMAGLGTRLLSAAPNHIDYEDPNAANCFGFNVGKSEISTKKMEEDDSYSPLLTPSPSPPSSPRAKKTRYEGKTITPGSLPRTDTNPTSTNNNLTNKTF